MKKNLLLILLALLCVVGAKAQKQVYIPQEWRNFNPSDTLLYKENDPENEYTWAKSRSRESENFIVFWDKWYGNTLPTNATSTYRVDIDDLLTKAELYYQLNVEQLKFADLSLSKLSKYKILIIMNHTTDWVCYGGGYDFEAVALWLSPNTCWPVGQSVAHEIGHSFQYMCYSDYRHETGFHSAIGMGAAIWEQTAQWQSVMAHPELMFSQSIPVYGRSHNYAFSHEWQRYQSYWFHYYLAEKYGDDIIGRVWRHQVDDAWDFNQVYMDMMGYTAEDLYREYMEHAMRLVTWDLNVCREAGKEYIGSHVYNYIPLGGTKYQVAYSSCPQATGYNVIPLNVPEPGTVINTVFTALRPGCDLAEGDPAVFLGGSSTYESSGLSSYNTVTNLRKRGFRLGYVALLNDGTRIYSTEDSVYCQGRDIISADIPFTVPDNVHRMWMVVSPAPTIYYVHQWDDNYKNDDQWPYQVEFEGTNIYGAPNIQEGKEIGDVEFTYDVYFKPANDHSGTTVLLDGEAKSALGTAFQMQPGSIADCMTAYTSSGPTDGKVMFYAAKQSVLIQSGSTANGYGHWFNSTGGVTNWGNNSYVFSEFDPFQLSFFVGQYPNACKVGTTYTIRQALRYKKGEQEAIATFVFNIHPDNNRAGAELTDIQLEETPDAIHTVGKTPKNTTVNVFSLDGRWIKKGVQKDKALKGLEPGIYIMDGKKYVVR